MTYTISVRALCEFTAKAGDLDLRFTPAPTALQGMEGHAVIGRRRGPGYVTELALQGQHAGLRVRGRADGFDAANNQLEEFKTFRGDLARVPANHRAMHWAQLRLYGAMLCRQRGIQRLRLCLVYFNIKTQDETVLTEEHSAESLDACFTAQCEKFAGWAHGEMAHRQSRDALLRRLVFPFAAFHPRQRQLAQSVYRTATRGQTLLAQAPTGIGKTIGTLFPVLKAMPGQGLDKLLFLVAKTSGRKVALQTLARIQAETPAGTLRVLELVARDKACEHPGARCQGACCPLAKGFYDRLAPARAAAVTLDCLDQAAVRAVALRHGICPYYLTQELARWADVVVADYNYYFDLGAMLYALTVANQWKVSLLVDEAHNLIERARSMYSANLNRSMLTAVARLAPPAVRRPVRWLARLWDEHRATQPGAYWTAAAVPAALLGALEGCVAAIADWAAEQPDALAPVLLDFFFAAITFCRLAAQLDRDSVFEGAQRAQAGRADSSLSVRNVIPTRFLTPRWQAAQSCVLFSATLAPFPFYRDLLGLSAGSGIIDVQSPFAAEQLSVRIVSSISTRLRERDLSIRPIVELIEGHYRAQPGNYLAFFSSFKYLEAVAAHLSQQLPQMAVWCQHGGMSEADRESFLGRFQPEGRGIGLAVLGGAFAEGIDLPGSRLLGAFVITLGLPQLNAVNNETRKRLHERFGAGYEYTYLYPGLRKVVQAAGRVIRSPADRGVVYLIDDRYTRPQVRRLLPQWWVLEEFAVAAGTVRGG